MKRIHIILFTFIILSQTIRAQQKVHLVILHTNDTHSQIEPTDKNATKYADMGGYARRMGVIKKIREKEANVLLVDAGDFCQGSPYFNAYNGRIEVDGFNRMNYDAVTLGNHEFDNGTDTLASILKQAHFKLISSNYQLDSTALKGMISPYTIITRGGIRIGVMALNVEPKGLIFEKNYKGLRYLDPVETAKKTASLLKKKEKCDVVVCLSHLGGEQNSVAVNDYNIARQTSDIDVIIGGHSHSMITDKNVKNAAEKNIIIAQMAKSGLFLGRIDLDLEKK